MCKTGLHVELRAQFILESVADLRSNLQQRGLDLIVRQGKPEDIVPAIAKATGAHTVILLSPLQTSRMDVCNVNCGFLGYCFSQLWPTRLHLYFLHFPAECQVNFLFCFFYFFFQLKHCCFFVLSWFSFSKFLAVLLTLCAFLKVFAHKETCSEETTVERGVKRCLAKLEGGPQLGVGLQFVWGGTLYHLDDLPFSTAELPDVYTQFRKVKQVFSGGIVNWPEDLPCCRQCYKAHFEIMFLSSLKTGWFFLKTE